MEKLLCIAVEHPRVLAVFYGRFWEKVLRRTEGAKGAAPVKNAAKKRGRGQKFFHVQKMVENGEGTGRKKAAERNNKRGKKDKKARKRTAFPLENRPETENLIIFGNSLDKYLN